MFRRLLSALLSTAAALALAASPAAAQAPQPGDVPATAATVDGTYVSLGAGRNAVFNPTGTGSPLYGAGSTLFSVGGATINAYCVQRTVPTEPTATFTLQPATAAWAPKVAWIAANHASVPTPPADANDEGAAVQIAIWHFTDGDTVDGTTVANTVVRDRATALIAAAADATLPTALDPALAVSATRSGGDVTVTATLSGIDALGGQAVTFTVGSGTATATTDGAGVATATLPAEGATVAASWTGTLPPGALLVPGDSSQRLITAQAVPASTAASAPMPPAPATTTAPPTTAPPTTAPATTVAPTTPAAPSGELPYTGAGLSPWLAVAGTALGALAVLLAWRARRTA